MTFETPYFLEAVTGDAPILFSARQLRTLPDAIWASDGVIGAGDLVPSPRAAGANMSVDVSGGLCVITGDSISAQGKYVQRSTAVVNLAINTAPSSGTRVDLIVAQVYDKQADGGTTYGWAVVVLPGTTTVPPSAIEVGRVTVPAGTTTITAANISLATRQYAGAATSGVQRPAYSAQGANPPFSQTGTLVDFLAASWAPLVFTMPPSGMVFVTISADLGNSNTNTSTVTAAWRATGGATVVGGSTVAQAAGARQSMSRRTLVTGAAGATITLTPQWRISSGDAGSASFSGGTLVVEFVS